LSTTTRLIETLAILLLCAIAAGCGSVGEPRPPLLNIPERADDFVARQTPEGIVLEWTWPRVTTEGEPLNDLARFDVYGLELAHGSALPDAERFERESRPLAAMRGDDLKPYSAGQRVRFVLDPAPWLEKFMALGVRAEGRGGQSVFSNLVLIEITHPPGRPGKPSITLSRDAIVLEWTAAEDAGGYIVERSTGAAGPFLEIGRSTSPAFRDTRFEFGESYNYRVRAVAGATGQGAEGASSETVSTTARDIFAPAKPVGLRAVATGASVELSWEQNAEFDLAGYRVRRRQGSDFVVLNETLLESASYSDRQVKRGEEYFYQVTTVDAEGNESEPSEAIAVRVPE
jgi:hypothetical protein